MKDKFATTMSARLERMFGFTANDLPYNRAGRISPTQVRQLQRWSLINLWGTLLVLSIALILTLLAVTRFPLWAGIITGLIVIFLGLGALINEAVRRAIIQDARQGVVKSVQGHLEIEEPRSNNFTIDDLSLQRLTPTFFFSRYPVEPLFTQAKPQHFVVYYLPKSKFIMALEPITADAKAFFEDN